MASQGEGLLHTEYDVLSTMDGHAVRRAGTVGIITDAQVVAATSADDLSTDAQNVPNTVHQEYQQWEPQQTQQALARGEAIGDFTDARVQASTSVESLAEKTNAADGDLGQLGQGPL